MSGVRFCASRATSIDRASDEEPCVMALTDSIVKPLRKVLPGFRDIRQTARFCYFAGVAA